jgi:hypothetical protein
MEHLCPPLSVYDCPPDLEVFLWDCRVSGNGIARELGQFFPLPAVNLASETYAGLTAGLTIGHAARARAADKLAALQAANSAIATLNHLAGTPLGDKSLECSTFLDAHVRALSALLEKVGTFIRNLRLHEKRQINQNEWNFDYVTDIHMFAAETGTVVLDPETQRGAFCRIDPNCLSLPPDGAGAKVDLRQILPPEELDPRRVLKDSPPTDEALGKIPIVKAYNTADYSKIILRLVKAGIDGL